MHSRMSVLAVFLVVGALLAGGDAEDVDVEPGLVVANAERDLDLTSQLVESKIVFELENTGKAPVRSFLFTVDKSHAGHLAFLEVSAGATEESKVKLRATKATLKGGDKEKTTFKIDLKDPINAGQTGKVTVLSVYSHLLRPYPTEIAQNQPQLVVFDGHLHVFTPYTVKKQTTTARLSPGTIESYSKHQPVKAEGQVITYGPFENVAPFSGQELRIHFENETPFLTVTSLTRVLEISHWGNVAVEEHLEIVHTGAKLKGSFSRFDYQRDHRDKQSSVKAFKTVLPADAADVYYRDEIGNISTSHLRNAEEAVELEIRPRFPLFGGWKTNYVIGYNVPSYEYLYSNGNQFLLKMRFVDHIFDNFVIDKIILKVILPEKSWDIKLSTPFDVKRGKDELHHTYLDIQGRPVIVASKENLVEQHIQDFQLHYTFDRVLLVREPFMLIAAFFLILTVVVVSVRLDFRLSKDSESKKNK